MYIKELRKRHPSFVYEHFSIRKKKSGLDVRFTFKLDPYEFTPKVFIPVKNSIDENAITPLVFHLGLIEAVSYWKAACSPNLIVRAGYLSTTQINWWRDLFLYGLGEFYYRNGIDFTVPNFLNITSVGASNFSSPAHAKYTLSGDLILVGGGKDSIVTLELLNALPTRRNVLVLNPSPKVLHLVQIARYREPLIAKRTIDPQLLELNAQGYLNGHTPFSAYLAFLGILVGKIHSFQYIIASNERSSEEANVTFRKLAVNHQYSKTYRFERLFREYTERFLPSSSEYFSFLRPLYELQIVALFAKYPDYFNSFISCNRNRGRSWCGSCAKCAFIFLALFSYLADEERQNIFGKNFLENSAIQQYIYDLVGLGRSKPFECVGTETESIKAVHLAYEICKLTKVSPPPFISILLNKLPHQGSLPDLKNWLQKQWSQKNFLPPRYAAILRSALKNIV